MNLITGAAIAACEKIINKALDYDPATRLALAKLEGKILAVKISVPPCKCVVFFQQDSLRLMSSWDADVDTEISGSPVALAQLASTPVHNLKNSGVTVAGDLQLLADLQQLINNLDIDWEEMLTQIFGDLLGHQTAEVIRKSANWQKQQAQKIQRLGKEFVTEELQAIPSKFELESFSQQVDELRLAADRLVARVNNLRPSP